MLRPLLSYRPVHHHNPRVLLVIVIMDVVIIPILPVIQIHSMIRRKADHLLTLLGVRLVPSVGLVVELSCLFGDDPRQRRIGGG